MQQILPQVNLPQEQACDCNEQQNGVTDVKAVHANGKQKANGGYSPQHGSGGGDDDAGAEQGKENNCAR